MRKSFTLPQSSLRFRRWSRKGYAAFISVQRAVTIGRLTSNIIERFQKKNLSLHTGICMSMQGVFGADEEEYTDCSGNETGLSLAEWQLSALLPVPVSNECAQLAGCTHTYNNIKGGMYLRVRSTFFYARTMLYQEIAHIPFGLIQKETKDQGCVPLATPFPSFAVTSETRFAQTADVPDAHYGHCALRSRPEAVHRKLRFLQRWPIPPLFK